MNKSLLHALGYALAIAVFSGLWLVVMTVTGWYRDPDRMELALVASIVEVILLILAHRQLRNDGAATGARAGLSVVIVLVAAILSGAFAFFHTSGRDQYFTHLQQAHGEGLRRAGRTDAEIVAMLANHPLRNAKGLALNRFRNTVVYGVIGTLLGLAVVRRRKVGTYAAVDHQ